MNGSDKIAGSVFGSDSLLFNDEVRNALRSAIVSVVLQETSARFVHEAISDVEADTFAVDFMTMLLSPISFSADKFIQLLMRFDDSMDRPVRLFEEAAITLGKHWECDDYNFFDITVAIGRLQSALQTYCDMAAATHPLPFDAKNVLISTVPGEQHAFPAALLQLKLRQFGYETTLFLPREHEELSFIPQIGHYDCVCLSWTTDALTDTLARLSRSLEELPRLGRPIVLAGGSASAAKGKWLVRIGVDEIVETAGDLARVLGKAASTKHPVTKTGTDPHSGTIR
ncbi:MAG: hypothetical protein AAGI92_09190 [Pseudomonadota bacterium]